MCQYRYGCHGRKGNQEWLWQDSTGQWLHGELRNRRCLAVDENKDSAHALLVACNSNDVKQKWEWITEP